MLIPKAADEIFEREGAGFLSRWCPIAFFLVTRGTSTRLYGYSLLQKFRISRSSLTSPGFAFDSCFQFSELALFRLTLRFLSQTPHFPEERNCGFNISPCHRRGVFLAEYKYSGVSCCAGSPSCRWKPGQLAILVFPGVSSIFHVSQGNRCEVVDPRESRQSYSPCVSPKTSNY